MKPTPGELAQMRGDLAALVFTENVTVSRITRPTSQTTGMYAETKTTVWTGLVNRKPAAETRLNTRDNANGDMATALSYWEIAFPVGAPVLIGDRVVSETGRVFDVIGVLDKSTQIATYVYAQERTSGPSASP